MVAPPRETRVQVLATKGKSLWTVYRRAHVEISNVCNLQCHFCPSLERPKQIMSPEAFKTLAPQLKGMVEEVALHLMGEPFYHPQFASMLELCADYQLPVNLTTNGILLHGDRLSLALQSIIRQVNISVHSFQANFAHRDPGAYIDRVLRFVRLALQERPDLYVNLRLWDLCDPDTLSPTNEAIRHAIEQEFGVQLEADAVDVRRRKNYQLRGRVYLHFDSRFTWPSQNLPLRSETGFCHGLTQHFGIHADGTVVPCCLDSEANIPLGNIKEQALADILQGERAESMRRGFARGELREDFCKRCPFIARFDRKAKRLRSQAAGSKSIIEATL